MYYSLGSGQFYLLPEPRLNARWQLGNRVWLKASLSQNRQFSSVEQFEYGIAFGFVGSVYSEVQAGRIATKVGWTFLCIKSQLEWAGGRVSARFPRYIGVL